VQCCITPLILCSCPLYFYLIDNLSPPFIVSVLSQYHRAIQYAIVANRLQNILFLYRETHDSSKWSKRLLRTVDAKPTRPCLHPTSWDPQRHTPTHSFSSTVWTPTAKSLVTSCSRTSAKPASPRPILFLAA